MSPSGGMRSTLAQFQLSTSDVLRIRKLREQTLDETTRRRRARFKRGLKLALAGAALLLGGHALLQRRGEHDVTLAGLKGDVQVSRASEKQPLRSASGMALRSRDVIRTGADSSAELALGDGTRVVLGPRSILALREIRFRPQARVRARVFQLQAGTVLSRVRKRPNQYFAIVTAVGRAVARGTEFSVTLPSPSLMRVATLTGAVEARTGDGIVRVRGGQQAALTPNEEPPAPTELTAEQRQVLERLTRELGGSLLDRLSASAQSLEDVAVTPLADVVQSLAGGPGVNLANLKKGSAQARAQGAMQALVYALELSEAGEYPAAIDPKTLAELSADQEMRDQILGQFKDRRLEYYKQVPGGYEIAARVDDEAGALVVARNGKITVKEGE